MKTLVDKAPGQLAEEQHELSSDEPPGQLTPAEGAALRGLRVLLLELDPMHTFGNLRRGASPIWGSRLGLQQPLPGLRSWTTKRPRIGAGSSVADGRTRLTAVSTDRQENVTSRDHPAWQSGQAEIAAAGGADRRSAKNADGPLNQSREAHHAALAAPLPRGGPVGRGFCGRLAPRGGMTWTDALTSRVRGTRVPRRDSRRG